MGRFFQMFFGLWSDVISAFDDCVVSVGGYSVSYASLLFAVLGIGLIISVFWRGAKT